jgi:CheY-like chemotaxis protein
VFDVILMDLEMPRLDGLAATRRIRAGGGPNAHTPIIALTGHAMTGDRDRALDAGMNGYLSKPFKFDMLIALVAELTGRDGAADGVEAEGVLDGERLRMLARHLPAANLDLLVRTFLDGLDPRLSALGEIIRAGAFDQAAAECHSLAGAAGAVGAAAIEAAARQIEVASRSGAADIALGEFGSMLGFVAPTKAGLAAWRGIVAGEGRDPA